MTWNLVKLELACMNGDDGSLRKLHHSSFLAFCHRRQHPSALGSGSRSVRAACTHNKNLTTAFVVVERCGTPTMGVHLLNERASGAALTCPSFCWMFMQC